MNHEESTDKNEQDRRYRGSQDDIRAMRTQLDKLIGEVGGMKVAIVGNDMGTEGMVGQIKAFKSRLDLFEERLDLAEMAAKQAASEAQVKATQIKADADRTKFYLAVIWTLIGSIATGIFTAFMNYIFHNKK